MISVGAYGPLRTIVHRTLSTDRWRQARAEADFYSEILKPNDLCFDVGGNIGAKTEVFLMTGARVVAFEPQPDCFGELVARNSGSTKLTALNKAVGSNVGHAAMSVHKNRAVSSIVPDWEDTPDALIEVPVTTLDDAIQEYGKPKFIKIDVEGFELEVLKGLSHPISFISLEYHLHERGIQKIFDCLDLLAARGDISMNITLGETPGLKWPKWVRHAEFRDWFPSQAPRTIDCSYGDIFIETK